MTEPQRFFFVHMHKAAGTTLNRRLQAQFSAEEVYPSADDRLQPHPTLDVDLLRRSFAERRAQLRLIVGHFPLCTTDLLGVPFSTFTVLRDPVERTLSMLRRTRERDRGAADKTIEQIYDDPVRFHGLIHNHMVKMLSLGPEAMTRGALTRVDFGDHHLETAKRNLTERIDVFGVQEHFEPFCAALADRFGWRLGPPMVMNPSKPQATSDELRARIAEDNRLDVELYRFAVDRLERRHDHVDQTDAP